MSVNLLKNLLKNLLLKMWTYYTMNIEQTNENIFLRISINLP